MATLQTPQKSSLFLSLFLTFRLSFSSDAQCSPADIVKGVCSAPKPKRPDETNDINDKYQCNIYMAKSSIPNAGYGVFAGRDFAENQYLGPVDSPSISVTDLFYHNQGDPPWAHVNYFWSGDGYTALEAEETAEFTTNVGALANYHTYLVNIDHWADGYDDSMFDRFKDMGAGAVSYYRGHQFYATRNIEAGEELFADYGEEWLTSRGEPFEGVARRDDYLKAGEIVSLLLEGWNEGKMRGLDYDVARMIRSIVSLLDERVSSVLPKTRDEIEALFSLINDYGERLGEKPSQELINEALAFGTTQTRNVTWLQEHGMCLDNLIPGKSTIEQAGYGAFTTRHIQQGSMIVPMPLLLVTDRSAFDMYTLTGGTVKGDMKRLNNDVVGKQLLLNYCFSHHESSLMVCPTTNSILVNHCSTRRDWGGDCGIKGPNAKVRWGMWDETTSSWLQSTVKELTENLYESKRGLSMELIALRDIDPNEEVTIDYGIEWENAFLDHAAKWKAPDSNSSGFENYASSEKLNQEHANFTFKTLEEQDEDPYPDNIQTMCYKYYDEHDDPVDISSFTDEDILLFREETSDEKLESVEYFGYHNEDELHFIDPDAPNQVVTDGSDQIDAKHSDGAGWFWPCQILTREQDNTYYVRILHNPSDTTIGWVTMRYARVLYNYPGQSIKFGNKRYTSDQFLPGAFRHHIELDDDMLPDHWKNLK